MPRSSTPRFSAQTLRFLRGLKRHNDREWFKARKEEYDACVRLQREAFGLPDMELSPRRHLIVARSAGGWTLGAFAGRRTVGFVLNQVAVRRAPETGAEEVCGYSHMMAVARDYQNRGVGARLKWAQRARALKEGRDPEGVGFPRCDIVGVDQISKKPAHAEARKVYPRAEAGD